MMRRILQVINGIMEQNISDKMPVLQETDSNELRPLVKSFDEELEQAAKVIHLKKNNFNYYIYYVLYIWILGIKKETACRIR